MRLKNIAEKRNIGEFVRWKLSLLQAAGPSFEKIYPLMFSERDNIFYETGVGYRIIRRTYGESFRRIEAKRRALSALLAGMPEDSTVGLCLGNGPDWIEAFWSILGAGYRPLLLNTRLPEKILTEALHDTGAVAVWTDSRVFPEIRNIHDDDLSITAENSPETFGTCFYVMSSGTSGHGKVCAYTAAEVYHILLDSDEIVRKSRKIKKHFRGELKQLDFLPYYHIFGLVAVYLWFGFFSRTFVHLPDMTPETLLKTIRRHHVTHIFAVPLFWEKVYQEALRTVRLRGEETFRKFELGLKLANGLSAVPLLGSAFSKAALGEVRRNLFGESISFMISGGGPLKKEALEFFNGIGYHFVEGFGMSEIGITSVELSENRKRILNASVGKPLRSAEYRINEAGELLIGGPGRASFILCDGARKEREDWLNSHDLSAEKNGHYYILGRQDELIVGASGENLNPNLYEPEFLLPGVTEACILPVTEGGKIAPVLLLSVEPFSELSEAEKLRRAVNEKIGELKLSGEIRRIFMTTQPLIQGEEFKLPRKRLLRDYTEGRIPEAVPEKKNFTFATDELSDRVRGLIAKSLDLLPSEIGEGADFFTELGGSSLDYYTLISSLEKEFGISLPAEKEKCITTAEGITAYLRENLKLDS